MRFYTKQHNAYCGIDLHARSMYMCILSQDGEILLHRNMKTSPEMFLKAIAPSREELVVCVACLFTWYWLADLCAREGMPFVLGHALSMKAIHGGKAKNETDRRPENRWAAAWRPAPAGLRLSGCHAGNPRPAPAADACDAQTRRVAHAYPADQSVSIPCPRLGKRCAYKANRDGGAERFPEPAVQKSIAVDLALIGHYDQLLRDVELSILKTAKQHHAQTLSLLRTVPGIGDDPELGAALRNP